MPTEKTRTTHVRRIAGTGGSIDVERVDELISHQGRGPDYRKTTRKMFWADEANDAAHPTRTMTAIRIEDPQDEENFIPLHIIEKLSAKQGQGHDYLKSTKKYVNDPALNQTREVSIRRVYHWDTEPTPPYTRIPGTEDREQYLDVAVIESLTSRQGQGPGYKQRTLHFNTDPIKAFSEPAPADADLSNVVHLDPWQNIINVSWRKTFIAFTVHLDATHSWEGFFGCGPATSTGPRDHPLYAIEFTYRYWSHDGTLANAHPEESVFRWKSGDTAWFGPLLRDEEYEISGMPDFIVTTAPGTPGIVGTFRSWTQPIAVPPWRFTANDENPEWDMPEDAEQLDDPDMPPVPGSLTITFDAITSATARINGGATLTGETICAAVNIGDPGLLYGVLDQFPASHTPSPPLDFSPVTVTYDGWEYQPIGTKRADLAGFFSSQHIWVLCRRVRRAAG